MASHVRNGANSALGTGLTDSEANASLLVTADGFFSGVANPVVLTGGRTNTIVGGLIDGGGSAFTATGGDDNLTVLSTGTITGSSAAVTLGSGHHTITNYGTVAGYLNAFQFFGGQAGLTTSFENHGLIRGNIVHTSSDQNSFLSLHNTGKIIGSLTATAGNNDVRNDGLIKGNITFGAGHDNFHNDGIVRGEIKLGNGSNQLDNGANSAIYGNITGGSMITNAGDIFGDIKFGMSVTNSGHIKGQIVGFIEVLNEGVIDRSVTLSGEWTEVQNTGLIKGGVICGAGKDHVGNGSGTIKGIINLGAGNDQFEGGESREIVVGGVGQDTMSGGAGADTFIFRTAADSVVAARDTIYDFAHLEDNIELTGIDASSGVAGNQAFTFIGARTFDKHAGQLRAHQVDGNTIVSGDVNGDGAADFAILLTGTMLLTSADFLL